MSPGTTSTNHLSELIGPLGLLSVDERKAERLAGMLGPHFDLITRRELRCGMLLERHAAGTLVTMGLTLAVTVSQLRPRP